MGKHIAAIAFDYGGVLAQMIDNSYIAHMADVIGVTEEVFYTSLWKFRADYDLGVLDATSYWKRVVEDTGTLWPQRTEDQQELVQTIMHIDTAGWTILNPGMLRWIRTLRSAGYRTLMISNMGVEIATLLVKNSFLKDYFEHIIISGEIHINKPDREIFLISARKMDLLPEEILFFDDLPQNIEGAVGAGFHAIQFTTIENLYHIIKERYPTIPLTGMMCNH